MTENEQSIDKEECKGKFLIMSRHRGGASDSREPKQGWEAKVDISLRQ